MGYSWVRSDTFGKIAISIFIVMQILDGCLTYAGVTQGLDTEANPLISWLMSVAGVGLGLSVSKVAAMGLGIWLYKSGAYILLLAFLSVMGFLLAVFPWAYLLLKFGALSG